MKCKHGYEPPPGCDYPCNMCCDEARMAALLRIENTLGHIAQSLKPHGYPHRQRSLRERIAAALRRAADRLAG